MFVLVGGREARCSLPLLSIIPIIRVSDDLPHKSCKIWPQCGIFGNWRQTLINVCFYKNVAGTLHC